MRKQLLTFLCFCLFFNLAQAQLTLNTVPPLTGGNGSGGTSFQVTANSAIIIQGFNAAIQSSSQTVEIWYSATDLTGPPNITTANGWVQLGTAVVTGTSVGLTPVLQQIPISVNLFMTPGTTYRFYIGCPSCAVVYSTYNASSGNPYSDSFLTINTGTNIGYGGGIPNPTFHPRQFNGGVIYIPGVGLDLAMESIVAPLSLAVGNNDLTVNLANFAADTIYQADLHYSFDNGSTVTVDDYVFPTPIPAGQATNFTFPTPINVPSDGTYSIVTWVSDVNGLAAADSNITNDTLTTSFCTGLAGNFTIDSTQATSGTNYMSIQEALNDLESCGVAGPVAFNMAADTYNLQFVIPELLGVDSSNTVVFRGDSTNNNQVVLAYEATVSDSNYIVQLDGADWLSFEDLTFATQGTTYSRIAHFTNGADHNSIDNCVFTGDTAANTTSTNKALLFSENTVDNYNSFTNNTFVGGSYSVYWRGTSSDLQKESIFSHNVFEGWYYMGTQLYYNLDLQVTDNVYRTVSSYTGTSYGMYNYFSDEAQVVTGNKIGPVTKSGSFYAFDFNSNDGTAAKKGIIANNIVVAGDTGSTSVNYGMYFNNCGFQQVLHNSLVVSGSSTGNRALFVSSGGALELFNNNISNFGSGTGFYLSSAFAVVASDNNNIYAPDGEVGFVSAAQSSLSDWQNASGLDQNSISVNPEFTDWYDVNLHVCNDSLNNAGIDLQGLVNFDIDGDARTTVSPDIGAYEFISLSDFAFVTDTSILCNGGMVTLTGATDSSSNIWSTGDTTQSIQVSLAGSYSVNITGVCGAFSDTIEVVNSSLAVSVQLSANISCFGASDASASALVSGGEAPYSYTWSTGATTSAISGLAAGSYSVSITDALGCSVSDLLVITAPTQLMGSAVVDSLVTCNGLMNGGMSTLVSGGSIPYSYSWSNSATTGFISSLGAGTFSVTITDANGCSTIDAGAITEPAVLLSNANVDSTITCNGGSNGGISVLGIGGTMPYSYAWSNGSNMASATSLVAGTYTVTVSDNNGCVSIDSVAVNESIATSLTATTTANVLCNGVNTGEGNAVTTGGTAPYTYTWSSGDVTAIITNLAAGTYTVTSTDANGCMAIDSTLIIEPVALSVSLTGTDVTCVDGNDGEALTTVSGGTAPYIYQWSTPSLAGAVVNGLSVGTYSVTISDANGCLENDSALIGETHALPVINLGADTSICSGDSLVLNGGNGLASYMWSTGETSSMITASTSGTYWVSITDLNGCANQDTVALSNWSSLSLSTSKQDVRCQYESTGWVAVNVTGGTAPFTIIWNDILGQTSDTATNLINGSYDVTVTDINGCMSDASATVGFNYALPVVDLGPDSDTICETYTYIISAGEGFSNYQWSTGDSSYYVEVATDGVYSVIVTDDNGCENGDSIVLVPGICVGIEDINESIVMRFYPNPTTGHFQLQLEGLEGRDGELSILSLEGKVIFKESLENLPKTLNKQMDLSSQAKGVYIVKLTTENNAFIERIILQ